MSAGEVKMKGIRIRATGMLVTAVLITGIAPGLTRAANGDEERPIRLYANAPASPIGRVDSFGEVTINGRGTLGEQLIWGGELLRVSRGNVNVRFDSIGQVRLTQGAMARFSSAFTRNDDGFSGKLLVGAVVNGDIAVNLADGAGAYIEAGSLAFAASPGASFRLGVREGQAVLKTEAGQVNQVQTTQRNYIIRPVRSDSLTSVRARTTRQIQVQVTDENDRPVPDAPVIFSLADQAAGSLGGGAAAGGNVTVTTNAQGIATTSFTAGPSASSTSVTATVAGTSATTTIGVTTTVAAGILTGTTLAVVAAAVTAGTVATVVAVNNAGSDDPPPVTVLPPVIRNP
jgi:hypothetical protein